MIELVDVTGAVVLLVIAICAVVLAVVVVWTDRERERHVADLAYRAGYADGGERLAHVDELPQPATSADDDPPAEVADADAGYTYITRDQAEIINADADQVDDRDPREFSDRLSMAAGTIGRIADELEDLSEELVILALTDVNRPDPR